MNLPYSKDDSPPVALPVVPSDSAAAETVIVGHPSELAVEFHGTAAEYFRIWAVNLCLVLLTLGIFSAWAKVRKKRYLYANTTVDGTPFQYLGQPWPILKGRLIAAVLFAFYYVSSNFLTSLLPYVLMAGLLLFPWVVMRSTAFSSRYSAYRNMTFRFDARYRDALNAVYWPGIVPLLIVGTSWDWWGNYYIAAGAYAVFGLTFPWWMRRFKVFVVEHTSFGDRKGALVATGGQFFSVYFVSGLIVVGAGIVAVSLANAFAFAAMKTKTAYLLPVLFVLPIYAGYVLAYAYVQAKGGNLVWNNVRLGPLRFRSTLAVCALAKIYLTNALAILASVGLLTPWAVVRTLRYRASQMQGLLEGDLAEFRGNDATTVRAVGAEIGELFDVDLSL